MAIDFPSSPTNGQQYTNSVTGIVYQYDSTYQVWKTVTSSNPTGYTGSAGTDGTDADIGLFYASKSILM